MIKRYSAHRIISVDALPCQNYRNIKVTPFIGPRYMQVHWCKTQQLKWQVT